MEYELLGWPPNGPTLRLDHRAFSYAGKFVMSNTGKAVARDGEHVVCAIAFNEDRTASDVLWIRYITTHRNHRGEGIGPRLAAYLTHRAHDRGYDRVQIAVNNLFAYYALSKAGFGFTGRETGIAELVLSHPNDRARYFDGLAIFEERDLTETERAFLDEKATSDPPAIISPPV